MPLIYRAMKKAADDKPVVGQSGTTLGVRIGTDITPDPGGQVLPGTGGMSVSPSMRTLPPQLVPRRLRALVPTARGKDYLHVWRMGTGAFAHGPVAAGLQLAPDRPGHGTVQPDQPMTAQA